MSAISTDVNKIRNAVWADEVRESIAHGIEQCYSDVSNPTLQTDALEAALQAKIDEGEMAALTIGDGTITTSKIANGAITQAKLDPNISFEADDELDSTSTNAIQNKVVTAAISEVNESLDDILSSIGNGTILSDRTIRYNTLAKRINDVGGTKQIPCNISAGTKIRFVITTTGTGLTIRLTSNGEEIDTIINDNSHAATEDEVFNYVATANCDTITFWTRSRYSLICQSVDYISGTLETTDGTKAIIDASQISGIDRTRNYELEAKSMTCNNGKAMNGLYLDIGRKYFTQTNLSAILTDVHDAGLNALYLHFSENEGFRFGLDNMVISANGTTYDLSTALGKGVRVYGNPEDNDNYLTQTEMSAIIAQAKTLGIAIIPCFDMPSHMAAILDTFSDFQSPTARTTINLADEAAVNFTYAALDKYLDYFQAAGCKYWCLGADEVQGYDFATDAVSATNFVNFVNGAIVRIIQHGMLPFVFNDLIGSTNITDKINKGAIVLFWSKKNDIQALDISKLGYRLINMSSGMYIPLDSAPDGDPSTFDMFYFQGDYNKTYEIDKPLGANISIWCSKVAAEGCGENDGGEQVLQTKMQYIESFGQAMQVQKKKVTKNITEGKTVSPGSVAFFDVDISGHFTLASVLKAAITNHSNMEYVSFSNISCDTDTVEKTLHGGNVRIWFMNVGNSSEAILTSDKLTVQFL